jgi:beta-glucosidase
VLNVVDEAYTVAEWRAITGAIDAASRGSRLGIPVLYGVDAVHGANYTAEAALFPQNIGLAATFNPALVQEAAALTARAIRAGGIPWDFAPVLDIGRHLAWSRFYETFGEDPHVVSVMGVAQVRGLEGARLDAGTSAAATAKHYVGYSGPRTGRDRSSAFITERELRELYLPPYQAAVDAGVHSVMINSGDVNGRPVHASHRLLTEVLRDEMGFDGFTVSDWEDIKKLELIHRIARSEREATKIAVLAGVDMSMVPNDFSFYDHLLSLVRDGEVPVERIDEAVRRILRVKARLGLFDAPAVEGSVPEAVGNEHAHRTALQAARESITLLRNRDVGGAPILPLAEGTRVLVTGPAAASMRALNNGWTYTWQGDGRAELFFPEGRTVLDQIRAIAGDEHVTYAPGADFETPVDIGAAATAAAEADVAVVVLGESSYAEVPGSIIDMTLPDAQLDLLDAVAATGTPVVLVLVEGRPRVLGGHADAADAIVVAYNPSNAGGQAIAEVLFGRVNPSGRLPFTYPSGPNFLIAYDRTLSDDQDTSYGLEGFQPLARFGDGLSYTTFATSALTVPPQAAMSGLDDGVPVSVMVENTGPVAGHEVVLLYLSDEVARVAPPVERLVRFAKVYLEPGERRALSFRLDARALSFVDEAGRRLVEPGRFSLRVADQTASFTLGGGEPLVLSAR